MYKKLNLLSQFYICNAANKYIASSPTTAIVNLIHWQHYYQLQCNYSCNCKDFFVITGSSLIIGGAIGGILLVTIILLLLIIIIILLYRNKKSRGQLDIGNAAVAYKKAADLDQGANIIINPNPSYTLVKRESNAYSTDPIASCDHEMAGAYEVITSMTIKNPNFDDTESNDYDYIVGTEDLLATVK